MKLSAWAKSNGVSYLTAWRWFRDGKLPVPAIKTPTGMILVQPERTIPTTLPTVVYCRVSSHEKKDDLQRQAERVCDFCSASAWPVDSVVKEIASGMNDARPKLTNLLKRSPCRLVVEHKDRLTRFGFAYLETLLPLLGWEVVVVNRAEDGKTDLLADLVAVITSFCCRLYGLRRGHNKAKKIAQELKT